MATADRVLQLKLVTDTASISKPLKGIGAQFKKMGTAAKGMGKALGGFLVTDGIDMVTDAVGSAIEGFRAGEDAARAMSTTWKNLKLDSDKLAGTLDKVGQLAVDMGFDDVEVTNGFNLFLQKTGNVRKSMRLLTTAMDLARSRGIPLSRAIKLVSKDLDGQDASLRRSRGAARRWARNHPLEVTMGAISEQFENFVGFLTKGEWEKAMEAFGGIGPLLEDLLFGKVKKKVFDPTSGKLIEIRGEGLLARGLDIGQKLVDGIIQGLGGLADAISDVWDERVANVDWLTAAKNALTSMFDVLTTDADMIAKVGIVGGAIAAAMFVSELFVDAILTMFKLPAWLLKGTVSLAAGAVGRTLGLAVALGMFLTEAAANTFRDFAVAMLNRIPTGKGTLVGNAAINLGAGIQAGIIGGIAALLGPRIEELIDDVFKALGFPDWVPRSIPGLTFPRRTGGPVSQGSAYLVGEGGPELFVPGRSGRIWSNADTMRMGGGGGTVYNISIQSGVGDPVEIGRQVDKVLRAYRFRAGVAAA